MFEKLTREAWGKIQWKEEQGENLLAHTHTKEAVTANTSNPKNDLEIANLYLVN